MRNLIDPLRLSITNDLERDRIVRAFSDPNVTERQASRMAFETVFAARLRLLAPEHVRQMAAQMPHPPTLLITEPRYAGFYNRDTHRIRIILPEEFQFTPVHYDILMHESEHMVQQSLKNLTPELNWQGFNRVSDRYLAEEGAMFAEWQYLSVIPGEVRARLLDAVVRSRHLDSYGKMTLQRKLANAGLPARVYVRSERKASRYSHSAVRALIEENDRKAAAARSTSEGSSAPGAIALLGGGAAAYAAYNLCEKIDELQRMSPGRDLSKADKLIQSWLCWPFDFSQKP